MLNTYMLYLNVVVIPESLVRISACSLSKVIPKKNNDTQLDKLIYIFATIIIFIY